MKYPQSLFVTFFNTGSDGELLITYKYIDKDPEDAEEFSDDLYQIEDTKVINEEADLTTIYIFAVCGGIALVVIILLVVKILNREKRIKVAALKDREDGVA